MAPAPVVIPEKAFAQTVAVLGRTGSGKSYTAKGQIERLLEQHERACIIDPTGIWWGLKSTADGKSAGFPIAVFGGLHADMAIAEASATPLATLIATENLPAIVDVSEMTIGERTRFMTHFLETIYRLNRKPLNFVVDEADLFAPQRPMPGQTVMLSKMEQIVRRGRVRGFRPWLITQRPAELHKSVLSQAGTLIAMRMTAPQDRDAIGAWIDGQADRAAGKAVLADLPKLPDGTGYLWSPALDFLERINFPRIKTFDSGRTPEHGEAALQEPTKLAAVDLSGLVDALKPAEPPPAKGAKSAPIDGQALQDAERAAYKRGWHVGQRVGQAQTLSRCRALYEEAASGIFAAIFDEEFAWDGDVVDAEFAPPVDETLPPGVSIRLAGKAAAVDEALKPAEAAVAAARGVSRPQKHLLDVLAQLHALGIVAPEKVTLAVHAAVSQKSSTYGNNLGALRTAGLIDYPSPGCIALTPAGRKVATAPARLGTAADLRQAWMRAVSGPQSMILAALIKSYPKAIARDELARLVGASASSSTYGNNLGALRTMGAIDYPAKGSVIATRLLFPAVS